MFSIFLKFPLWEVSFQLFNWFLAKYRAEILFQAEAEEAEERAGLTEHAMSKLKVFGRASSAAPFM